MREFRPGLAVVSRKNPISASVVRSDRSWVKIEDQNSEERHEWKRGKEVIRQRRMTRLRQTRGRREGRREADCSV